MPLAAIFHSSMSASHLHVTDSSHKVDRRSGRPEQPIRLTVECARLRPRCAHPPAYVAPTPHRSGCAPRSCTTLAQHCRTRSPPPAARQPPSVDAAPCAPLNTPPTPGSPPDRESRRHSRRLLLISVRPGQTVLPGQAVEQCPAQGESGIPGLQGWRIDARQVVLLSVRPNLPPFPLKLNLGK